MDANGEVDTSLPWIGSAGSRIRDRYKKRTQHGHELLEVLRSNQHVAISTHGEANRQCWTWLSPFKTRHRLDYMITRQTDADHGKARVDCRMPVGLSGFRDRRPLIARVCTRERWKQKQPEEEKPKRWDRTLVERECKLLLNWSSSKKGKRLSQYGRTNISSTPGREINKVVHSSMTTPDIEAEIVKRTLDTCCTVPQRKARTLRLPAEILALVEQKQRLLQRWRGARGLCEKEQLSRQYKSQTAAVKRAVRAYKRRKWEDLAGELEQAVSCNQVKSTYAMVKRLAPVQAPPRVTVRQKDGSPTWGHDGEITARRDALVTIFGAEPLSLEAEPQPLQAKKWIPPETLVTYKAGDAQWAVAQLSNGKAGPCIRSGGPADQNKFGGAVAEQWKAVVGRRAQAPLSACAQAIAAAWTETATTGRLPQEDKDAEIAFLPKPGKDIGDAKNWRTIALLSHIGKAWAIASVRPLVPAVAKVAGPCQFGSLPGRSMRDAAGILENVFERFTNSNHQASRRSCLLAGFLFDLEKAFDTIPRDRLWAAVSEAAKLKGLSVVLEAGHEGTCYTIRNSLGRPVTKGHVTLGVRQGSVEGPLCFILLYALSITQARQKRPQQQRVIAVVQRGNTVSRLDLSDLCFVDDLVSLLIFWRKSQLSNGVTSARDWKAACEQKQIGGIGWSCRTRCAPHQCRNCSRSIPVHISR